MNANRIIPLLVLGVLFTAVTCFAQTASPFRAGRWLVMGSSSASFTSYSGDLFNGRQSVFQLAAGAGQLLSRDFAIGGLVEFATSDGSSAIGIGPLVRYYIPSSGSVTPFLGAFLLYNSYSPKNGDGYKDIIIGLQGGIAIALSTSVTLDLGVDVKLHNYSHDSVSKSGTEIVIPLGVTVFL